MTVSLHPLILKRVFPRTENVLLHNYGTVFNLNTENTCALIAVLSAVPIISLEQFLFPLVNDDLVLTYHISLDFLNTDDSLVFLCFCDIDVCKGQRKLSVSQFVFI